MLERVPPEHPVFLHGYVAPTADRQDGRGKFYLNFSNTENEEHKIQKSNLLSTNKHTQAIWSKGKSSVHEVHLPPRVQMS